MNDNLRAVTWAAIVLASLLMIPSLWFAQCFVNEVVHHASPMAWFGYVFVAWAVLNLVITLPSYIVSLIVYAIITFIRRVIYDIQVLTEQQD